ncbi:MAG: OmpA family protein [Polyangiaceae bacterium]
MDSDGDGIADSVDACPEQPGSAANQGCPNLGVVVSTGDVQIIETVRFAYGVSTIGKEGGELLGEIAKILAEHPELKMLEVEGFASGDETGGVGLSEKRAKAVIAELIKLGVAKERLVAHAVGATRPRAAEDTAENRAKNRRVEFRILNQGSGDVTSL